MLNKKIFSLYLKKLLLLGLFVFSVPLFAYASATDGTIDGVHKYAKGLDSNVGKINFALVLGNVHVTDSRLTGNAWSELAGWINLAPTNGGVTNDAEGHLAGYAWGQNTGWINFAPTRGGVTIDNLGIFHGYAWSQNLGWISFNCLDDNSCGTDNFYLQTDWKPFSLRPSESGGGGHPTPTPTPTPTPNPTPTPIPSPTPTPGFTGNVGGGVSGGTQSLPSVTTTIFESFKKGVTLVDKTTRTIRKNVVRFVNTSAGSIASKTVSGVGVLGGSSVVAISLAGNVFSFADVPLLIFRLWSVLLVSLGLRKKRAPWGTVYDSVTKQPLDPVYVVLKNKEGKEVGTAITDLDGRFGFLAPPGPYEITTRKTNYQAPSIKLAGKTRDELYDNLYFGGEVILNENTVITKNIPMDPLAFDWNEFAKRDKKLMVFYSKNARIINIISTNLFYLGFISATVLLAINPNKLNLIIIAIYVLLLIIRLFLKPKTLGTIMDAKTKTPMSFAIVRVFRKGFPQEIFHRVADKYGHYYCLLAKGEYHITIDRKNPDESYTTVYTSGIINAKRGIINQNFLL